MVIRGIMRAANKSQRGGIVSLFISLGNLYPSPGYCGEIIRMWACRIAENREQHLDEDEFLEVERIPLNKAVEMVLNNEIQDSKTQVGILKAAFLVENKKL